MFYYFIIFIVVLILYAIIRRNILLRQVALFNRLLYEEKNPEGYIDEVNKLLKKTQPEREKNINLIQKTTGLFYLGKFEEAIKILTEDIKKIPPNWHHIYYNNLILCLYLNGEIERANKVLEECKEIFEIYENMEYKKLIKEMLFSISDFYNGKGSKSKLFFEKIAKEGKNDYKVAIGYYFLSKINEAEGDYELAEENMEKARFYGQGSFME